MQHSNPSHSHGKHKCNKSRCKTCPFLNCDTTDFMGPSGRNFTIKSTFNCQTPDVIYIISCNHCSKLYTGETYRTPNERFTKHRNDILHQRAAPVATHFNSPSHNLSHLKIAAVWQNRTGDLAYRKFMESRIIEKLGCIEPFGMNIKE